MQALVAGVLFLTAVEAGAARNYPLKGDNELSGGIGFSADLTAFTPGGFKWFNEYGVHLSGPTWFNFQLNVVAGGGGRYCAYDNRGRPINCSGYRGFGGTALEFGAGVKLKWRLSKIPLQIHAKFGGALDLVWFHDFLGAAVAFRGGPGVRYFVLPELGVGAELMVNLGPGFYKDPVGIEFFGAIDLNFGVEWRF